MPSTPLRQNQSQTVNNSEFIVYSRKKKKSQEDIKQRTHLGLLHETEPNSVPKERHTRNIDSNLNESTDDELNLPIAKRKWVKSCTNNPIYNFISYKSLSLGYQAFVTSLMDIRILKNIQEALQIPEWNIVIEEEIQALEEWDIGTCWTFKRKASDRE